MTQHEGRCLCGAVSFTIQDLRKDYGTCHCKMCQRWAGSALLAVTVEDAQIRFEGEDHIGRFQSSDWAERAFCTTCGTGLWYRVTIPGPHQGEYEIPIGLLDNSNGLEMTREIFIDLKPDAFAFDGDREQLTEAQVLALYGQTTEGA